MGEEEEGEEEDEEEDDSSKDSSSSDDSSTGSSSSDDSSTGSSSSDDSSSEEEDAHGGQPPAAAAAAAAVQERVRDSTMVNNALAIALTSQLQQLTATLFALTPDAQAALRATLNPAQLLALHALQDRSAEVLAAAQAPPPAPAQEAPGGGGALAPGAQAPAQAPLLALPPPQLCKSAVHEQLRRFKWGDYVLLWLRGIYCGSKDEDGIFPRYQKTPPLKKSQEPGDLTWSRDPRHQGTLSKLVTLCTFLEKLVLYHMQHGPQGAAQSEDEAIAAVAAACQNAWGANRDYGVKGAREFHKQGVEYDGRALSLYYKRQGGGAGGNMDE